ncbi:hypothetical protein D7M11_08425 [Paenibacillus ginsengarvi]|uniref:N-acetyltransferase n=1 Tax=Paenibacillus ginsengarvi TaxID=400777 RepID=A0A3B0CLL4_9BACL|nr:hypothetical protein [Paenibacillus ginsengarvi]RKN85109.1 hypothetical protein D7M11_08425 [Paenibacillus ginsengarvi]
MNGEKLGGVVLKIDEDTQHNEVVHLYTNANAHGKGIGTKAWQGFKIVEFLHRGNPGPDFEVDETKPDTEYEFFHFKKVMD